MPRKSWMIVLGMSLALAGAGCTPKKGQVSSTDGAAPLCALSASEFSGWQAAGGAGFVAPDSAATNLNTSCGFFKWGSQMFLWLTSQDATGTMNMFSPTFYTAVESTDTGEFELTRNPGGTVNALGSNRPVTITFRARVNKPVILKTHTPAQLAAARADPNNLNDSTGQAGGGGVLVLDGAAVPVPGKAGYATYPVTYYTIQVNDVFAGLQANQAKVPYYSALGSPKTFPTTLAEAQQIQTASAQTFPDINQLALELKSSWVDTAYLTPQQAQGLITIQGQVPAFTQSTGPGGVLTLAWDGVTTATRTLALVGIHVVGAVPGRPGLVWSTFESVFNSPDNTYSYINSNYNTQTNSCPAGANCLTSVAFSTSNRTPTIFYHGQAGTSALPTSIVTTATSSDFNTAINSTSAKLVATNVVRYNPWGNQQPATPTVTDPVVQNNTMLLSLMQTLNPQLKATGGRGVTLANYFQSGSVWSNNLIPNQSGAQQFGSLFAANTTMETFQQVSPSNSDPNATANNCFSCHSISGSAPAGTAPGTGVSHVFPNVTTSTAQAKK